jgi:hypothetical protein
MNHPQLCSTLLWMFVVFSGIAIGGGIYEVRVVYPNWMHSSTPETLARRLSESGQMNAGRHFWPFISPMVSLLSLLNIWAALQTSGAVRTIWLASAVVVAIRSIATYSYFVPTMILRLYRPETMTRSDLEKTVRRWTSLSPLRIYLEVPGWIAALWVLSNLSRLPSAS